VVTAYPGLRLGFCSGVSVADRWLSGGSGWLFCAHIWCRDLPVLMGWNPAEHSARCMNLWADIPMSMQGGRPGNDTLTTSREEIPTIEHVPLSCRMDTVVSGLLLRCVRLATVDELCLIALWNRKIWECCCRSLGRISPKKHGVSAITEVRHRFHFYGLSLISATYFFPDQGIRFQEIDQDFHYIVDDHTYLAPDELIDEEGQRNRFFC
jgi:hypothetical protein